MHKGGLLNSGEFSYDQIARFFLNQNASQHCSNGEQKTARGLVSSPRGSRCSSLSLNPGGFGEAGFAAYCKAAWAAASRAIGTRNGEQLT